ncbi:MAG: SEC-C domain-containing protein, partial [Myxococcales bacterium]|nr:SEC-C domain-containing protein [Myxococcales bacterium]
VHGPGCNHDHDHHHHAPQAPVVRATPKVGRNEACPCGSGKKFKRCCGAKA